MKFPSKNRLGEIRPNFAPLGLRGQKFNRIFQLWDSGNRNSARSVAHFAIYNPKGRQPFAEGLSPMVASASADNEFLSCWLFGLPIGKQSLGERLPTS
ncbi:MAG: hypothetical protein LBU34_15865 [Planctomycetaceae bacterium]|nr:hypothetical protein [Planctomycetaceae bacterium]